MIKLIPHGLYVAFVTFFLGFLQLLLLMFWDWLSLDFNMDWVTIIKTCGILFFSSAVLGSCVLSYFLHSKKITNRKAEHFIFIVTPLTILTLTIVAYTVAAVDASVDQYSLKIIQILILAVTFIYLTVFTAYERSVK